MKQAIKKTEVSKTKPLQATITPETHKISKTEEASHASQEKTNQLNRFLEASCDCV